MSPTRALELLASPFGNGPADRVVLLCMGFILTLHIFSFVAIGLQMIDERIDREGPI